MGVKRKPAAFLNVPRFFGIFDRMHRTLLLISLPLIVLLSYGTASLHFPYTPDDTYIYLQFERNATQGNGISFNAGEPTYGVTSPLWMFIIALGGKLGTEPEAKS